MKIVKKQATKNCHFYSRKNAVYCLGVLGYILLEHFEMGVYI